MSNSFFKLYPLDQETIEVAILCAKGTLEACAEEVQERLEEIGEPYREVGREVSRLDIQTNWKGVVYLNYTMRIGVRVLVKLMRARLSKGHGGQSQPLDEIYDLSMNIPWEELWNPQLTFMVNGSIKEAGIRNAMQTTLKIKDAIADRFRAKKGFRPSVNKVSPDIRIFARLSYQDLEISLDTSGESLSHRFYREEAKGAPLRENLAACLLRYSLWNPICDAFWGKGAFKEPGLIMQKRGEKSSYDVFSLKEWMEQFEGGEAATEDNKDKDKDMWRKTSLPSSFLLLPRFIDPMCGSGTLPIEAALILKRVYPATYRESFPYEHFAFLQPLLEEIKTTQKMFLAQLQHDERDLSAYHEQLELLVKDFPPSLRAFLFGQTTAGSGNRPVVGCDLLPRNVGAAKNHSKGAHVSDMIDFRQGDFFTTPSPFPKSLLVMNPPYGRRLQNPDQEEKTLMEFYKRIGDRWKEQYKGSSCWVISSEEDLLKNIGLRKTRNHKVFNGDTPCWYQQYLMV